MSYRNTGLASLLLALLWITGCSSSGSVDEVKSIIEHTKDYFIPDSRVNLFKVNAEQEGTAILLTVKRMELRIKKHWLIQWIKMTYRQSTAFEYCRQKN